MTQADLCVLVPTRGRPENVARLAMLWIDTEPHADLLFLMDSDDPTLRDSLDVLNRYRSNAGVRIRPSMGCMNAVLNHHAVVAARRWPFCGFIGDDHYPRTEGWADRVMEALSRPGLCYGNDLFQGERLPTAVFMTSEIVLALGYMSPPTLRHLYIDNAWKALGEGIGRLTYLNDVIIEHRHPEAQKAEWDDGYRSSNSPATWAADGAAWDEYKRTQLATDVATLRELLL